YAVVVDATLAKLKDFAGWAVEPHARSLARCITRSSKVEGGAGSALSWLNAARCWRQAHHKVHGNNQLAAGALGGHAPHTSLGVLGGGPLPNKIAVLIDKI